MNKTHSTKPTDITRVWHLIDAHDQILGRLASRTAQLLIGKHKPYYAPHLDCGDYVIVTNAQQIKVTGNKLDQKIYYRHSGYPGGLKSITLKDQLKKDPVKIIEAAVKGMLPKNKLQQPRLRRLKVFLDDKHPYQDKLAKDKPIAKK